MVTSYSKIKDKQNLVFIIEANGFQWYYKKTKAGAIWFYSKKASSKGKLTPRTLQNFLDALIDKDNNIYLKNIYFSPSKE